jgi:hypothetical protein
MLLQGLGKFKKFKDLIGTRTSDLIVCSIAPQPSTLPNWTELNSMVWVRERTTPTELPPLVGEVIANFYG